MTTGKTIALTRRTFVGKVMSLLLNVLSSLVITFLPRSKRLLISWLQSPSAVILEPRKIKSDTVSPSISHEVMGHSLILLQSLIWLYKNMKFYVISSFVKRRYVHVFFWMMVLSGYVIKEWASRITWYLYFWFFKESPFHFPLLVGIV